MSSNAEIKFASCTGPIASLTTASGALKGCVRYQTSTSNTSAALPSVTMDDGRTVIPLQGKWIDIVNESPSAALEVAFGIGSAPTLVAGQLATFATGHVSAGRRIPPDSTLPIVVPNGATHVAWIQPAASVASTVYFQCSEGPVGER